MVQSFLSMKSSPKVRKAQKVLFKKYKYSKKSNKKAKVRKSIKKVSCTFADVALGRGGVREGVVCPLMLV
jgi:hypothetical protein